MESSSFGDGATATATVLVHITKAPPFSGACPADFPLVTRKVLVYTAGGDTPGVEARWARESLGSGLVEEVNETQWSQMTTAQFASYSAIIIPEESSRGALDANKAVWSAAVKDGNKVLIGTDPVQHAQYDQPEGKTLVSNSIRFAASGNGTDLYVNFGDYTYQDGGFLSTVGSFNSQSSECANNIEITYRDHLTMRR